MYINEYVFGLMFISIIFLSWYVYEGYRKLKIQKKYSKWIIDQINNPKYKTSGNIPININPDHISLIEFDVLTFTIHIHYSDKVVVYYDTNQYQYFGLCDAINHSRAIKDILDDRNYHKREMSIPEYEGYLSNRIRNFG